MPRKKKTEDVKPMGATRTRIDEGVAKLDKLKNHYGVILDQFTKAIQSSLSMCLEYSSYYIAHSYSKIIHK